MTITTEELTPLPCPACGNPNVVVNVTTRAAVYCPDCGMYGPCAPTFSKEYAIRQWNALPRALTWTDEPPKAPGMYWNRSKNYPNEMCIINVSKYRIEQLGRMGCSQYELWAGPIPEPREPK